MIDVYCNEALTGTFSLDTSSGTLSGSSTMPYAVVENVLSGKTIYIAIAPGEKTDFTAYWDDVEHVATKTKGSAVTFEAGKIYDLGNTSDWD